MVRRATCPVQVGDVVIGGGGEPIIQSMTSTPTHDVEATWSQVLRLYRGGSRIVRIAVPDQRALSALPALHAVRQRSEESIPLVGDIHFSLEIALDSLKWLEKIRVNPGNLLEHPRSRARGTAPVADAVAPLRRLFREAATRGRAVRIGVNQGSLSRRMVETLGAGPEAMVASAMEYVEVAAEEGFNDLVISLKSSDPREVVEANLQLAARCDYPLHVGVTEAGFGLQGRARSASGVGLLLRHGIADTIRVSLAEPPEDELPVAAALVKAARPLLVPGAKLRSRPVVGVQVRAKEIHPLVFTRTKVDDGDAWIHDPETSMVLRVVDPSAVHAPSVEATVLRIVGSPASPGALAAMLNELLKAALPPGVREIQVPFPGAQAGGEDHLTDALRRLDLPLTWEASVRSLDDLMRIMVDMAQLAEAGAMQHVELDLGGGPEADRESALDILQGLGTGQWRAAIIACPQCGRCRIDVSTLAADVRRRLGERRGVTIGVMGCIVNGPGEMQGADIGCVGEGPGKVALYRRGQLVARGVPVEEATERLEALLSS